MRDDIKEYYKLLKISEDASYEDIKHAYDSLIKLGNFNSEERLKIDEAYKELSRLQKLPQENSKVLYELSGDLFDDTFDDLTRMMDMKNVNQEKKNNQDAMIHCQHCGGSGMIARLVCIHCKKK